MEISYEVRLGKEAFNEENLIIFFKLIDLN